MLRGLQCDVLDLKFIIKPFILFPEGLLHLSTFDDLSACILPIIIHRLDVWVFHQFGKGQGFNLSRGGVSLGITKTMVKVV